MPEQNPRTTTEITIPPGGRVIVASDLHLPEQAIGLLARGLTRPNTFDGAVLREDYPFLVDMFATRPEGAAPLTLVLNGDLTQLPSRQIPGFNDFLLERQANSGMDIRVTNSNHAPFAEWQDIQQLVDAGIAVTTRALVVKTLFGQSFQIEHGHEITPLKHKGDHNPGFMNILNRIGAGMHAFDSVLWPRFSNLWINIAREILMQRYVDYAAQNLGVDEYLVAGHIHYPAIVGNAISTGMLGAIRPAPLLREAGPRKQMLSTLIITNQYSELRAFPVSPIAYSQAWSEQPVWRNGRWHLEKVFDKFGNPVTALNHPTHIPLGRIHGTNASYEGRIPNPEDMPDNARIIDYLENAIAA